MSVIQTIEELDAVLHWRNKHAIAIKERDALQLLLNVADQRNGFYAISLKGCGTKEMREAARKAAPHIEGDALDYILAQALAALQPTESGAAA